MVGLGASSHLQKEDSSLMYRLNIAIDLDTDREEAEDVSGCIIRICEALLGVVVVETCISSNLTIVKHNVGTPKLFQENGVSGYLMSTLELYLSEPNFHDLVAWLRGRTMALTSRGSLVYRDDYERWQLGLPVVD